MKQELYLVTISSYNLETGYHDLILEQAAYSDKDKAMSKCSNDLSIISGVLWDDKRQVGVNAAIIKITCLTAIIEE
jgi:hypothetical protein